jgi:RNA polymerase sigma-70 factor (ECF subfamily)
MHATVSAPRLRPAPAPPAAPAAGEEALVRAARGGDRAAYGRLHALHAGLVHGILLARVPPDAAEDLVQEAFVAAWRKLPRLRDTGAFAPWVVRIARRLAVQFHRRRRPASPLPEDVAGRGAPGAGTESAEEARRVLAAVQSLPPAYRETLVLRLVEGLTGPQIAERSGLTHGSVRVNLHRGMTLLRERLAEPGAARSPSHD